MLDCLILVREGGRHSGAPVRLPLTAAFHVVSDKEVLIRVFTLLDRGAMNEINFRVRLCLCKTRSCACELLPVSRTLWLPPCPPLLDQEFLAGMAPIVRGTFLEKMTCTYYCFASTVSAQVV